jgi:foldase protein PrsA
MKKFAVVFALLILAIAAFGCGGGDELPDGAVAQVGETVIEKTTLDTRIADIQTQVPGQTPDQAADPEAFKDFQAQILDYLVTLEIATQKADELGVAVTDEDVQAQLDQIKGMFGGDEAAFEAALKQQNMTLDQLMVSLRERELLTKSAEAVTKDVVVGDDEIASYYEEHESEFTQPEARTARHMLFSPGGSPDSSAEATDAEWEAVRVEAEAARKRITDGEDFAAVAREVSDDTGSKDQGGDLGEVKKGTMVPEFEEALWALKASEVSQPVKTQFGYHLIKLEQVSEARQSTLDEVKDQIKTTLLDEAQQAEWTKWLADAKESLGVVVADDYVVASTTTTAAGETTTTAAGETTTTAGGETTTTAKQ